ncbi:MAG: NAD(+)/NADH kinase [Coprococcus sp.]|nr:NAD(+)/NADH kinase [Coprococcus sp.]
MKKYLIVVNPEKDINLNITNRARDYIISRGGSCRIVDGFDFCSETCITRELTGDAECILVLGGDGTLLKVAGEIEDIDIPLYGINLGTVGFLTEGEVSGLNTILDRLLSDDFSIEERMMIKGVVKKTDGTEYRKRSLNDIVISRAGFSRLIGLNVSVGGSLLDAYEADGVVVATPTGSTGYNLSAGGPIVSPTASLMVITPVSPHSLTSKSIVLSGDEKISIEIGKKRKTQDTEAIVSFDGGNDVELSAGDVVNIYRSNRITKLIKANDVNFYEILRNKLGGSQK